MRKSILQLGTQLTRSEQSKVRGGDVTLCEHGSITVTVGAGGGYKASMTNIAGERISTDITESQMKSLCGWHQ